MLSVETTNILGLPLTAVPQESPNRNGTQSKVGEWLPQTACAPVRQSTRLHVYTSAAEHKAMSF